EDSEPLAMLYQEYLSDQKYNLDVASSGAEAIAKIESTLPDLVILDLMLPDMNGQNILKWIKESQFPTSVIVATGHGSIDMAVELIRSGAEDFLEKPIDANRLQTTVKNILEKTRLKHLVDDFQNSFSRKNYHGFIGSSLAMQTIYKTIDAAAPSTATIFITGESGTGKEVAAEAIHNQGNRRKESFIPLNCGAIPKDLMESEIFGHIKGAFTGAVSDRKGSASQADKGTLFLDEIGEMDLDLQTKLLRFVQTGTFQKVGSNKLEKVDVRFLCATNRDPLQAVKDGILREDLYYRLHVVPIHIPPLRDRGDDIMQIASNFLKKYSKEEGKIFKRFSQDVDAVFRQYSWPGNVRQIQNVIRNIMVLHNEEIVEFEHLPPPLNTLDFKKDTKKVDITNPDSLVEKSIPIEESMNLSTEIRPLAVVEREVIEHAINICQGNIPKAAALLEVSPSTIYRKKQAWEC
ncbi:MAG: sigma-54 dependent transcriptional regulator, partial [Pseudomonadales bacterium]|nr:sigma-54 dependent transcriptional regulator [Pseudomonadales bacterium]